MKRKHQIFSLGYFSNEVAHKLLSEFRTAHSRPVAMHIEPQSHNWAQTALRCSSGHDLKLTQHAIFCSNILAGAPYGNEGWDTGLIDEYITPGRMAFVAAAINPNVRVLTISSHISRVPSFGYRDYRDLKGPVVLSAAGNDAADWHVFRRTATVCGEIYMPGYLRVGESEPEGEINSNSQASGPAFICDHPRDKNLLGKGFEFYPTRQDVRRFLEWPYLGISDDCRAYLSSYSPPSDSQKEFYGTSGSAPYAGALVMRHTLGMKNITSYDIIPAVLMAAQTNEPPQTAIRRIENQSGMVFDPFHYGHGILEECCLQQALNDVWDIRCRSGVMTQAGDYSNPVTVEGRGYMSARTEKAQGPVVNTVLLLSFCNDEKEAENAEKRIPEYVMLRSPQGTLIHLPILFERKTHYGRYIRAGYQTTAFFGEDISKGQWQVEYSSADENPLRIQSTRIIAHTMHEKSPAHVLFKGFQKAVRAERNYMSVRHATPVRRDDYLP